MDKKELGNTGCMHGRICMERTRHFQQNVRRLSVAILSGGYFSGPWANSPATAGELRASCWLGK